LPKPGKKVEELLPILIHHKHLMRSVPMKEETLAKKREIPMQEK